MAFNKEKNSQNIRISIVIPVYGRMDYTKKCLESVFRCGSKYPFEIIVVDNASTDGTKELLAGLQGKIKTIHNDRNLGFAKACNQGAAASSGEYVLFLNNDTIVTDSWMDVLVAELDENPAVAMAGSKLLFPDETIQHAGVVFGEDKIPYHIYAREIKEKHYVNKKRKFNALTAACMLVRKNVFNKVGGFDEKYLNGYEDIDLCLKIRELGGEIMYCPKSVVYHYESISDGRGDRHKENRELFLSRWARKIVQDDYDYMTEDETQNQSVMNKNQKNEIENLKRKLNRAEAVLEGKSTELEAIKASKFWKLRGGFLQLQFVLFSPGKFLQKYFRKSAYLADSFFRSVRNEGLGVTAVRFWNFVFHGKGTLRPDAIDKKEAYEDLVRVVANFKKK